MGSGHGVLFWWLALCVAAVLNILAWSVSATYLKRRRSQMSVDAYAACRLQLTLSAAYVFGCAFRSALPIFDIPRICLFNCWLSSVVVGRSVATVAELCFVAQWGLMLRATGQATGSLVTQAAARLLVPLIAIAEICSWYSVLTTSNLGHIVEESLWALSASLFVASLIAVSPRCPRPQRALFMLWCIAGTLYVAYMLCVDVPMYWTRWITDEAHGRRYLSLAQGVIDASDRRIVSYQWTDWKSEIGWMSLYFTVAVWISLSLVHAAVAGARRAREEAEPGHARRYVCAPQVPQNVCSTRSDSWGGRM